jgi:cell volume regulation protein A
MSHIDIAKIDLFYVAIIIAVGLIASVVAKKIKVPDIVVFLVFGIAIGPAAAGFLNVSADSTMNQLILTIGACYLLFDGGSSLKFAVLKEVWITLVVIATVGVLITGAITAAFGIWVGIPVMTAVLLGAVTASTDPATLVPIFKQVPIKDRVAQTVMSESALNDAMGAIATFAVVGVVVAAQSGSGEGFQVGQALRDLAWEAGIGIALGAAIGLVTAFFIAHRTFGFFKGAEPFVLVLAIILAYLAADTVRASGFMAVFVFGAMIGNRESFHLASEDEHQEFLEHYVGNTALLMRMFIFILLGSQVSFGLLAAYWWQGLVLLAVFLFVARPATVFLCAGPDRRAKWSLKELLFMSWTRETGVIPAALVGILMGMKVPGMEIVGSITFIFILGTILIQAPTTAPLARKLGLLLEQQPPKS